MQFGFSVWVCFVFVFCFLVLLAWVLVFVFLFLDMFCVSFLVLCKICLVCLVFGKLFLRKFLKLWCIFL